MWKTLVRSWWQPTPATRRTPESFGTKSGEMSTAPECSSY
eukprot:COSAG01_NODE_4956_length_4590_cov_7.535070_5_plen_40_part_00